jgi:hypothetical protein
MVSRVAPETQEQVLIAIRSTSEPMTASQISKLLVAPHKLSEAKLAPLLEDFVETSKLRAFPSKTAKGKPRYWDRDSNEFGRQLIMGSLKKKGAQSEADLRKASKQLPEAAFQSVFQSLIDSRTLIPHPPLPKARKILFSNSPPSPEPYLRDIGVQLTKIVAPLIAAGVSQNELRQSLVQLVERAGVRFGASTGNAVPARQDTAADLVSLIRSIEPGADNGALVAARELRRAAKLDKQQFDRAVLDLARQGRLMLHRHDFANGLSPDERDELVTDEAGTYYVGMALRR